MKPFLGIDITHNKDNEQPNGDEFLVQRPSAVLLKSLEASTDNVDDTVNKSQLPKPFRIIQYICGLIALLIGAGILKSDVSLAEGYHNAPELYWAAGICAVAWVILWSWSKWKAKTVLNTDESEQSFSRLDGAVDAVYQ